MWYHLQSISGGWEWIDINKIESVKFMGVGCCIRMVSGTIYLLNSKEKKRFLNRIDNAVR